MTAENLVFSLPPVTGGALVFGDEGGTAPPATAQVYINAALPALTFAALLAPPASVTVAAALPALALDAAVSLVGGVTIAIALPGLTLAATANRDNATTRYLHTGVASPIGAAIARRPADESPWGVSVPQRGGDVAAWQPALRAGAGIEANAQQPAIPAGDDVAARWQPATGAGVSATDGAQAGDNRRAQSAARWQPGAGIERGTGGRHQVAISYIRAQVHSWQPAARAGGARQGRSGHSGRWRGPAAVVIPWQASRNPPQGREAITPPVDPPTGCYTPDGHLVFSFPWGGGNTALLFQCGDYSTDGQPVTVPVRKVYIVINTATLRRASDNAVVPTFSLSLSIDVGSWTWGWQASIPGSARGLVESTVAPVELAATINGTEYRLIAENISQERTFGDTRVAVTGRGKNAALDAPYAPVRTFANTQARTAQQLMGDALTVNNVSIGWTIDWGLTDWLVPAGAWAHQGSYISALKTIAQAAGGYLAPHPTADAIRVRHHYPVAPWDWAGVTPDFILPADVVTRESLQWVTKPTYNRVYVSGEGQGVLGRVTRAGTAGDALAQMVVDRLITHADAARQRGMHILGDTGRQQAVGLRLPVLPATGIIEPGAFVQYNDGAINRIGMVRATNVSVGLPEVWQTLEIETHVS